MQHQRGDKESSDDEAAAATEAAEAATTSTSFVETLLTLDDSVFGITSEKLTFAFEDILNASETAPISSWVAHAQFQTILRKYAGNFKLLPLLDLVREAKGLA